MRGVVLGGPKPGDASANGFPTSISTSARSNVFLRGSIWHIYSVLKASVMLRVFENILYYISVLNLFLHIFGQYIPTVSPSVNDRLACKIAPEEKSSKFKTTCDSMISLHLDQLH